MPGDNVPVVAGDRKWYYQSETTSAFGSDETTTRYPIYAVDGEFWNPCVCACESDAKRIVEDHNFAVDARSGLKEINRILGRGVGASSPDALIEQLDDKIGDAAGIVTKLLLGPGGSA